MSRVKVTHLPSIVEHSIDLVTRLALQRFCGKFLEPVIDHPIILDYSPQLALLPVSPLLPCSFLSRVVSARTLREPKHAVWKCLGGPNRSREKERISQETDSRECSNEGAPFLRRRSDPRNIKRREIDVKDDVLTKRHTRN